MEGIDLFFIGVGIVIVVLAIFGIVDIGEYLIEHVRWVP